MMLKSLQFNILMIVISRKANKTSINGNRLKSDNQLQWMALPHIFEYRRNLQFQLNICLNLPKFLQNVKNNESEKVEVPGRSPAELTQYVLTLNRESGSPPGRLWVAPEE